MSYVALIAALILGLLSVIHFYWAMGGHSGVHLAVPHKDGEPLFKPRKIGTLIVAMGLLGLALLALVLRWGELWNLPIMTVAPYLGLAVALVFFARAVGDFNWVGFFKKVKNSDFARLDTRYYSPLCLLLGLLFAGLSLRLFGVF